jgi:hypothetical protein
VSPYDLALARCAQSGRLYEPGDLHQAVDAGRTESAALEKRFAKEDLVARIWTEVEQRGLSLVVRAALDRHSSSDDEAALRALSGVDAVPGGYRGEPALLSLLRELRPWERPDVVTREAWSEGSLPGEVSRPVAETLARGGT